MVEQAMVIGDGQKFPAALIVPNFANLKTYCQQNGMAYSRDEDMVANPQVLKLFENEMEEVNKNFAQFEKIKKFELLPTMWTVDSGEMTPKLSLKRKAIMANNQERVERIYRE